jgi:hypothetical protein
MAEAFLRLSAQDCRDALGVAADRSGCPAHLLEKDVWVVWALAALYGSPLGEHLVFKGGTSLSKAYKIIRRFSEDVDLTYDIRAIVPDFVGPSGEALPKTRSEEKRWSSEVRRRLPDWVAGTVQPATAGALAAEGLAATIRVEGEKLFIDYEATATGSGYVAPIIMLEFGARSTGEPAGLREVVCDAADFVEGVALPTARPRTMHAERTFWEKATAIHVFCSSRSKCSWRDAPISRCGLTDKRRDSGKAGRRMGLYKKWCNATKENDKRKRYWTYVEKNRGRDEIRDELAETVRSHYDRLDRIADDVVRLGFKVAAEILRAQLPQTAKGRSGDLGEILATELVEEEIGLRVPVRRLRYKDGRNMAMRGDDFIGAGYNNDGADLRFLKGEAKSNKVLGKATVASARKVLNRDNGRCTPDSLAFVANRLLESADEDDVQLGRNIRDEVGLKVVPADRINHMLFTISGNGPHASLKEDFSAAGTNRDHYVVNLHVEDHQDFIKEMFEKAEDLGDD